MATCKGGTFTISNGGVYARLMVVAHPDRRKSVILGDAQRSRTAHGDHGQVVDPSDDVSGAEAMTTVIVDGKGAVTFLGARQRSARKDPRRLLMDL